MAVRVGIIGVGIIGSIHVEALLKTEGAHIVAICDTDRSRAEAAAAKCKATAHINFRTMFEREQLDALYVCLPPFAHSEVELLAAQKGIHLFVEKPVALSGERAEQIAAELHKAGIITSVGYIYRYMSQVDAAREFLKDRPIAMVVGEWLQGVWIAPWWPQREKSGGQIVEQVTHLFDLGRLFCGEVDTVFAASFRGIMARKTEGHTIDDADAVTLRFRNGVPGSYCSCNAAPVHLSPSLRIIAEDAVVTITYKGVEIIEKGRRIFTDHIGDPYLAEARAFIDAVEKKDPSLVRSDYADAVQTLKLTLAIQKSADTNKPVTLA